MPGQAVVTIRDKQWQCAIASTPQELVTGLSGVENIPPGTGVLFDMGWDYPVIDINTHEMLFALDIIFISSVYGVVGVLRNVCPGDEALFQGEPGTCFFLEVNAGEAEGIEAGDGVLVQAGEEMPSAPSWITGLAGLIGFAMMGVFMVGIARGITEEPKERPALHGPSGERLLPQTLHENGDIGLPLPFAGTGKDRLWWLATISGRTVTIEVAGISVLSQRQLENAFIRSAARISNIVTGKELPFAAATREKLWWLSTIGDKTVQVEVSGIRGLSERQMEDAFINSVAAITVTGTGAAAKPESIKKPTGTCYADAWRFVIRKGEGKLIHGTVYSGNRRIGHAWVETSTGWVWEPETGRYFTNLGFSDAFAPVIESRYTAEEAAIMAARAKNLGPWSELERRQYLKEKSPAIIPKHPRQPRLKGEIEFLPDSPEFLAYTIDDIGYREKIDSAFLGAIARARGGK